VIFLDEPTTGLDPRSRQAMWDVIGELVATGVTVFLTTQYLEEADALADRIAVIDGGRVVAEGTAAELKRRLAGQRLDLALAGADAYDAVARALGDRALRADRAALALSVATDGSAAQVRALLDELDPDGVAVERFSVHEASLDDVFLALTDKEPVHG
jgi:ABC-2 type transport system ATP-binding protein